MPRSSSPTSTAPGSLSSRPVAALLLLWAGVALLTCSGCGQATHADPSRHTLHVSVDGSDASSGATSHPLRSIQKALERAQPGDTILIAAGVYRQPFVTKRSGKEGAPISLVGAPGARITGNGSGRLIQIRNDYIVLRNLTIENANKLVWVEGAHHVRIEHDRFRDGGGECIRIKYLSTDVVVAHDTIDRCGLTGFDLARDEHNGEGVYIGTDPHQLDRNPTKVPDASDHNVVVDNTIVTFAAECVDIKEAAEHNEVLDNVCSHSRDPKGSGLDSRGNHNLFRGNVVSVNAGAGIRFGGYGQKDGIGNSAIDNVLVGNRGYGFLVLRGPQGRICENVVRQSGLGVANVAGLRPSAHC